MGKNNRGLLITLIVLLCVIALLLSGILVFAMTAGTHSLSKMHSILPSKMVTIFDQSYDASEIKNISIDNDAGDITVRTTNDGTIRLVANGFSSDNFSAEANGETLNVSSTEIKSRDFFNFNAMKKGTDIELYIPQDFDALSITSNLGDVDIENELNTKLTVENDMGNIDAKMLGGSFDIHTNMGNIDIERTNITENSSATTNMGDIEIDKTNAVYIDAKTSMGDCDVKNNTPSAPVTLTATTNMGNIEIND